MFDGSASYMSAENSASLNPSNLSICLLFEPANFYQGTGGLTRILMKGEDDETNGFTMQDTPVTAQIMPPLVTQAVSFRKCNQTQTPHSS